MFVLFVVYHTLFLLLFYIVFTSSNSVELSSTVKKRRISEKIFPSLNNFSEAKEFLLHFEHLRKIPEIKAIVFYVFGSLSTKKKNSFIENIIYYNNEHLYTNKPFTRDLKDL